MIHFSSATAAAEELLGDSDKVSYGIVRAEYQDGSIAIFDWDSGHVLERFDAAEIDDVLELARAIHGYDQSVKAEL